MYQIVYRLSPIGTTAHRPDQYQDIPTALGLKIVLAIKDQTIFVGDLSDLETPF